MRGLDELFPRPAPPPVFCRHFGRELVRPFEPKKVRVNLTRAVIHKIYSSDTDQAKTIRARFPLVGTTTEEIVNPTDPSDRATVDVDGADLSEARVPWDVELRPKKT
jgi:hypothetical protein